MPVIRVEFETTPEKAKKFHNRIMARAPFSGEKEQAINEAWDRGRTPTGDVHYRGISNDQPPTLKFDVEVTLEVER